MVAPDALETAQTASAGQSREAVLPHAYLHARTLRWSGSDDARGRDGRANAATWPDVIEGREKETNSRRRSPERARTRDLGRKTFYAVRVCLPFLKICCLCLFRRNKQ